MESQIELIDKLLQFIIKIGILAENQVNEAVKAILSEPIQELKKVKKIEHKIDKLDIKIDEICQNIFTIEKPSASDLRFILAAMKISNEIERIGDLSMSIIKSSKNIKEKHDLISNFDIAEILKEIVVITVKTNKCLQDLERNLILEIFTLNADIKHKSNEAIENIIDEMKLNPKAVVSGTNLIISLKHMERIADHNSNIAESIYFILNAKSIKHEKLIIPKL